MGKHHDEASRSSGGTRGIGRAICEALRDIGYEVVSDSAVINKVGQRFKTETGLKSQKFDFADCEACQEGIDQIVADKGELISS